MQANTVTRAERTDWLNAIATQADVLLAEPEDMFWIAGAILLATISKLPEAAQQPTLDNWTTNIAKVLQPDRRHASRH